MATKDIQSLISQFVAELESLVHEWSLQRALAGLELAAAPANSEAGRIGRAVSPARRLQGRYIGLLRSLRGQARQRVRAAAKRDGVAAALKLIERLSPR
jgi:hypothetical protein